MYIDGHDKEERRGDCGDCRDQVKLHLKAEDPEASITIDADKAGGDKVRHSSTQTTHGNNSMHVPIVMHDNDELEVGK